MNQLVTGGISVLNKGEFIKKQILVYEPFLGDKMSYKNDNMVIRDGNGKIKYQVSCYRIFMVLIVWGCNDNNRNITKATKIWISIMLFDTWIKGI